VVAPTKEGTAAGRYLQRRGGDGGYMVILQCDGHAARKARLAQLGVRFAMAHDTAHYKLLQLHPADTGGSFLEIDEQIGGEALDGPWEPAGDNWQTARRTDVVSGITVAFLQSDDPRRLAARWGHLLDVPIDELGAHEFSLDLDNASLRFVNATDGRGEGLAGLLFDGALGAQSKGAQVRQQRMSICGTEMAVGVS
ncbi:MAG: hypothetical protein ABIQ39_08080, partial [Ilumatobacteraceae bacterium]